MFATARKKRKAPNFRGFPSIISAYLGLLCHCEFHRTALDDVGELDAAGLARAAINALRRLYIDVLLRVVLGCDDELVAAVILLVELDGHFVEDGTAD